MTQNFTPRDYQRAIMAHIAEHERCNVWAGMGTGKTVSTLASLDGLTLTSDPFPALVLAPLRVATSTSPSGVHPTGSAPPTQVSRVGAPPSTGIT